MTGKVEASDGDQKAELWSGNLLNISIFPLRLSSVYR